MGTGDRPAANNCSKKDGCKPGGENDSHAELVAKEDNEELADQEHLRGNGVGTQKKEGDSIRARSQKS